MYYHAASFIALLAPYAVASIDGLAHVPQHVSIEGRPCQLQVPREQRVYASSTSFGSHRRSLGALGPLRSRTLGVFALLAGSRAGGSHISIFSKERALMA